MSSLHPVRDQLVVKRLEAEEKTPGGLILAPVSRKKQSQGTVTAIGSGRLTLDGRSVPLEVSIGDVVVFQEHAGVEVKVDGEEFLVLAEGDVLAILK